jgi:hypothetical protein
MKRLRFAVVLLWSTALLSFVASAQNDDTSKDLTILRGRAVCVDHAGRVVDALLECEAGRFGFIDQKQKLFLFNPADRAAALFNDPRVRGRELQITARLDQTGLLELIRASSLRGGKLHDIYYFCEVCNIKVYVPGQCPCCRDELQFVETPL